MCKEALLKIVFFATAVTGRPFCEFLDVATVNETNKADTTDKIAVNNTTMSGVLNDEMEAVLLV